MKIIDVLIKTNLFNDGFLKKIPESFRYDGYTFKRVTECGTTFYVDEVGDSIVDYICRDLSNLNSEVEIIEETIYTAGYYQVLEEDNKIEKIDFMTLNTQKEKNRAMKDTINKLIEEVNKLKESER